MNASFQPVLRAQDLSIGVEIDGRSYTAVDRASFEIARSEILGLVGESGCGKSLTACAAQNLFAPNVRVTGGALFFEGENLLEMPEPRRRKINGKDITMIFQEPMASLNPLMRVGDQIGEALALREKLSKKEINRRVARTLAEIGLHDIARVMRRYPRELSGGMAQRAMIAMATICGPKLMIADEPTSALDVTTQSRVIALLKKMSADSGASMLFISHDLAVTNILCDRILVMYAGRIVESGSAREVFARPAHEYTKALVSAMPSRESKGKPLRCAPGHVPPVTEKKSPCPFAPRCPKASRECFETEPENTQIGETHFARCHRARG